MLLAVHLASFLLQAGSPGLGHLATSLWKGVVLGGGEREPCFPGGLGSET